MAGVARVAALGAGAMGTALAWHCSALGATTVLLVTDRDQAVRAAWLQGAPHPALQVPFSSLPLLAPEDWDAGLVNVEAVLVAVSSAGLEPVLSRARDLAAPQFWLLATKDWEVGSLRRPSEVAQAVFGSAPIASLAGPALAAEIVVRAPTGLPVAARDHGVRRRAAAVLAGPATAVFTTSDVVGTETASAVKNVVAVAVGLAEGLAQRITRARWRARSPTRGRRCSRVACWTWPRWSSRKAADSPRSWGDLYVTCGHGRNGRFGRLLGKGATVTAAIRSIGSTVEGVANTTASLALAERAGIALPSAHIVERALRADFAEGGAPERLREIFASALAMDVPVPPVTSVTR